jgi:hypothetical protein
MIARRWRHCAAAVAIHCPSPNAVCIGVQADFNDVLFYRRSRFLEASRENEFSTNGMKIGT